jgi:nicotinate-nucleotide pyrophosphorylase (carboxylating)
MHPHAKEDRMNEDTVALLLAAGLEPGYVGGIVATALAEDTPGWLDVTTVATVPDGQRGTAELRTRVDGTVAGLPVAAAAFDIASGTTLEVDLCARDGDRVCAGDVVARVTGRTGALLTAERTALNLLCHLSGIATATSAWVQALAGSGTAVRDTRKTTPGLRALEKYAVRCGGGLNHRMSLSDMALVKDNHVAAAGGVAAAFAAVRARFPGARVEVECDTLEQVAAAVAAGADAVMLDNMSDAEMAAAVRLARRLRPAVTLEASGGITLDRAAAVAATGVDYIAVGALTHSAPILDIGLDLITHQVPVPVPAASPVLEAGR